MAVFLTSFVDVEILVFMNKLNRLSWYNLWSKSRKFWFLLRKTIFSHKLRLSEFSLRFPFVYFFFNNWWLVKFFVNNLIFFNSKWVISVIMQFWFELNVEAAWIRLIKLISFHFFLLFLNKLSKLLRTQ